VYSVKIPSGGLESTKLTTNLRILRPTIRQITTTTDHAAFHARNVTLSRRLGLALIVFCAALMLLGPAIADTILSFLGCRPGNDCGRIANVIGSRFTAFYRADSLADVPFIFAANFWPVVLAWGVLIVYVRLRKPTARAASSVSPPATRHEYSASSHWARWAHRFAVTSLIGLVLFCVLFGTPLLATETARFILSQLGCEAVMWNFGGPQSCLDAPGFWTPRLRDYMTPFFGWNAPFLLGLHFHKLLIAWGIATATLFYIASVAKRRAGKNSYLL
jgi:hypothetical protein